MPPQWISCLRSLTADASVLCLAVQAGLQEDAEDISKLRSVIEQLMQGGLLESKHRDHQLSGNWKGHRDCHIEPDWLLIYRITNDDLHLERTGSHSDLFK